MDSLAAQLRKVMRQFGLRQMVIVPFQMPFDRADKAKKSLADYSISMKEVIAIWEKREETVVRGESNASPTHEDSYMMWYASVTRLQKNMVPHSQKEMISTLQKVVREHHLHHCKKSWLCYYKKIRAIVCCSVIKFLTVDCGTFISCALVFYIQSMLLVSFVDYALPYESCSSLVF